MIPGVFALLAQSVLGSLATLFLKKSTDDGLSIMKLIKNRYLYLGGGLYVLSAFMNLYLLKILPYSVVVPLGALTYIWTLLVSRFLLGECITKNKIVGILLILAGVSLVAAA